jgi:hypothetical protein
VNSGALSQENCHTYKVSGANMTVALPAVSGTNSNTIEISSGTSRTNGSNNSNNKSNHQENNHHSNNQENNHHSNNQENNHHSNNQENNHQGFGAGFGGRFD